MSYKYPKCISKYCPISSRCDRFVNGEESQLVDYDKVDTGKGKCEWFISIVSDVAKVDLDENKTSENMEENDDNI